MRPTTFWTPADARAPSPSGGIAHEIRLHRQEASNSRSSTDALLVAGWGVPDLPAGLAIELVRMGAQEVGQGSDAALLYHENVDGVNAEVIRKIDVDLGGDTRTVG